MGLVEPRCVPSRYRSTNSPADTVSASAVATCRIRVDDFINTTLEDRLDKFVLGGDPSTDGPHADARMMRTDLVADSVLTLTDHQTTERRIVCVPRHPHPKSH